MAKKIGDKSCQSNSDKRVSDFGSFLVISLLLLVFFITIGYEVAFSYIL